MALDEADRLLDMGFTQELNEIFYLLPKKRQNLLFSATFPDDVNELADFLLKNPASIQVAPVAASQAAISQKAFLVDIKYRTQLLRHLIEMNHWQGVLVFFGCCHRNGLGFGGQQRGQIVGPDPRVKVSGRVDGWRGIARAPSKPKVQALTKAVLCDARSQYVAGLRHIQVDGTAVGAVIEVPMPPSAIHQAQLDVLGFDIVHKTHNTVRGLPLRQGVCRRQLHGRRHIELLHACIPDAFDQRAVVANHHHMVAARDRVQQGFDRHHGVGLQALPLSAPRLFSSLP